MEGPVQWVYRGIISGSVCKTNMNDMTNKTPTKDGGRDQRTRGRCRTSFLFYFIKDRQQLIWPRLVLVY